MKNKLPLVFLLSLTFYALISIVGCSKNGDTTPTLPILSINTITNISTTSSTINVKFTSNGNSQITESGVCYATTWNPEITKSKVVKTLQSGTFSCLLTGLLPETTYYVRAYATNGVGTAYSNELPFLTTSVKFWIPDPNFRSELKKQFPTAFDLKDSLKTTNSAITGFNGAITVYGIGITSLSGIEYFPAITTLNCSYNLLTNIDLSKNLNLRTLICNANQLTNLDVTKFTALTSLSCYSNQLTSLDVSKNTQLVNLFCNSNQLAGLDLSKNTLMDYLDCTSNKLTNLDLSKNPLITTLWCTDNQLTSLDINTLKDLSDNIYIVKNAALIYIGNTGLTTLKINDAVKQKTEFLNIKRTMPGCTISTWSNGVQVCGNYNPITNTCP
jgi:hypothetical protein